MNKTIFLTTISLIFHSLIYAQISFDFEDDDISLWGIEGDGYIYLDTANGNPNSAILVEEPATGERNFVITPPAMTGEWLSTSADDSIYWDLYVHQNAGSMASTNNDVIELKGPGGHAQYTDFFPILEDTFMYFSVSLNPDDWTMISGTWESMIEYIDIIRIRAEYVDGDEYVLLDNIGITFTPVVNAPVGLICSHFDAADGFDGWNFIQAGSLSSDDTEGNPPNSIEIGDASGELSYGYAPPKFRGDMTTLNDTGVISFDIKDITGLTEYSLPTHLMRLAGPGGEATYPVTEADAEAVKNTWNSFSILLDESLWTVTAGSWNDLLANVTVIEIALEFYNGTSETVYFDNFCIGNFGGGTDAVYDYALDDKIEIFPNPNNGNFYLRFRDIVNANSNMNTFSEPSEITIYNSFGEQVFSEIISDVADAQTPISIQQATSGLYFIFVRTGNETATLKLLIQK